MRIAIYPGSFDPITLGHLNLIKRASRVFDKLVICVMVNHEKSPLFTVEERMDQIRRVTAKFDNVEVDSSDEFVANFAKKLGACAIIRGLRALSDFEKECQMAVFNKKINPDIDTFFLAAEEKYMYLSSSAVRELAMFGGDLTDYAPRELIDEINAKYAQKNSGRR
jgi:pantetheine-phosphate adenylyltransferase